MTSLNRKKGSCLTWFKLGLLLVLGAAAGSLFTPYPAELVRAFNPPPEMPKPSKPKKPKKPQKTETETQAKFVLENPEPWSPEAAFRMPTINLPAFPPALPERSEPGNYEHITELTRGLNNRSNVNFLPGTTASQDRVKKDAYQLRVSLNAYLPKAAGGDELLKVNPELPTVLTNFAGLMEAAKVSPWYHDIYLHKQNRVRKNAALLNQLLDRHNFYDTDTVLDIVAPDTNRHVLWIQADMDVVSDGSDGDRLPDMPKKIKDSEYYQPSTSYKWRKRTKTPNPLLPAWQERLKKYKEANNQEGIKKAERIIGDLKIFSFLLAEYDSFIVVPLTVNDKGSTSKEEEHLKQYRPTAGDYAVVIVGNKVYPAIVGDFGPKFKTGEASLRLCKTVNSKASVNSRPISHLGVSYIIFPGTKEEENGPINYDRLNQRCRELVAEIGGLGPDAEFVEMKDLLPQPAPEEPKK